MAINTNDLLHIVNQNQRWQQDMLKIVPICVIGAIAIAALGATVYLTKNSATLPIRASVYSVFGASSAITGVGLILLFRPRISMAQNVYISAPKKVEKLPEAEKPTIAN